MKYQNIFTSRFWHMPNDSPLSNIEYLEFSTIVDKKHTLALNLQVTHFLGTRIAEISGEPIIQYNDIVCPAGNALKQAKIKILEFLKQNKIDLLYLHNVRCNSKLHLIFKDCATIVASSKAPFIDLTHINNMDDYFAGLSKTTRKSKRRSIKKIQNNFDVTFETLIDDDISKSMLNSIIQLKRDQLSRSGLTSRLFASDEKLECLKKIIHTKNKDFQTIISILKCDGNIAAAEIGYLHNQTYYSFLGAMADAYQEFSAGTCQLMQSVEWAIHHDIKIFDFLAPEDHYKYSWTGNHYIPVNDMAIPTSIKGKLYAQIYLKTMRPILKRIYLLIKKY